jgi:hypothetical protein
MRLSDHVFTDLELGNTFAYRCNDARIFVARREFAGWWATVLEEGPAENLQVRPTQRRSAYVD